MYAAEPVFSVMGRLAVYLSGHGLGHAARTCEILRHLPPEIILEVTTEVSGDFLRRESGRPDLAIRTGRLDVGLVQADNRTIDWEATANELTLFTNQSDQLVQREIAYLTEGKFEAVFSDMPTLAMRAARAAGIPGTLLTNFTWDQIYRQCPNENLFSNQLLDHIEAEVGLADQCLVPGLNLPIPHPSPQSIGLISRAGRSVREELVNHLGVSASEKLVLVYLGAWGDQLGERQVGEIPQTTFLTFHPLPAPMRLLEPAQWSFHDVLASVDAVLAKPGYGIVASSLAHGTPLVHHPRTEFAEYPALATALTEANNFLTISTNDLEAGRWEAAVRQALEHPKPSAIAATGAALAAQAIRKIL